MDILSKEVVIAAYDKDYNWINQLDSDVKVTVYKKGFEPLPNEILIEPNVGRDVHTFFYHLVNNYNNLSDYTFFSQDYPFDHVENYISLINGDEKLWFEHARQSINGCWFFNTDYYTFLCDKTGLPNSVIIDDLSLKIWPTGEWIEMNLEPTWHQLFNMPCPDYFAFTPAGHFCISREQVLKKPIEYYKIILNILETDPNSPWVIERLESYIFLHKDFKLNY
jgi:hypothetical protein